MKRCARCHSIKAAAEFYGNGCRLSARCRSCHGVAFRACIVCGSQFEGSSNAKLCSETCRRIHRPQTFLDCETCGQRFGPVNHLARRFCSRWCAWIAKRTGRKPKLEPTAQARYAQSIVAYYVRTGKLERPTHCNECGLPGRIEAAHENYNDPLAIRWLCRSCHVKWDKRQPKGGCVPRASGRSAAYGAGVAA
jgi:hypothetical protein